MIAYYVPLNSAVIIITKLISGWARISKVALHFILCLLTIFLENRSKILRCFRSKTTDCTWKHLVRSVTCQKNDYLITDESGLICRHISFDVHAERKPIMTECRIGGSYFSPKVKPTKSTAARTLNVSNFKVFVGQPVATAVTALRVST